MRRWLDTTIQNKLLASRFWSNRIKQDCQDQKVFLTIRDNRVDFYHKGGKLFGYDGSGFKTHLKYASAITANDKNYLTESQLAKYSLALNFQTNYKRIKENCSNYSGIESLGVSDFYHKYSYLSDISNVIILDIEISFESLNGNNNQDRLDILLYDKTSRTLQFVEAKHFTNKEIWSKTTPKVIDQIQRYESQIANNKPQILAEYAQYVRVINAMFNISLLEPININSKVILLVFGFDNDQKNGRLQSLIIKNPAYLGTQFYAIGNIKQIVPQNLWNAKIL